MASARVNHSICWELIVVVNKIKAANSIMFIFMDKCINEYFPLIF